MTIYLSVAGLIYTLFLSFIFFSKKKIKSIEMSIYGILILVTNICILTELAIPFQIKYIGDTFVNFSLKLNLVSVIVWLAIIFLYILSISSKNLISKKQFKTSFIIILLMSVSILMFLPIEFYNLNNKAYSYGAAVNFVYMLSSIIVIISLIVMIKDRKNIKKEKYLPIVFLVFSLVVSSLIQKNRPDILLNNFLYAFTVFFMYFTIENPDVQMLEQVSLAKEAAEKANNAKSEFLSNMSHEIRTPLNAIVGFSESLKEDNIPEESKYKVEDIIIASNNLLEIVNGILDISKIEANKLEIINKEYDVHSMFDELVALTKARIGDKDLEFRVNIDKALPSILYGDNLRLKQIILNILTNAVKYTKEGFIDFTVSTVIKDNVCRLIVSVEDSGIGMKEESLNKLFTKFERLNVEKEITIEGTGLGLAITKKLVELMNGKIIVQSVYGKGSKFTVSIDQRIIAVEKPITKLEAKSESKIVDANGAKLLIVDDNELNIKVASILLKKYNFNIESCTSAIVCIAKINNGEQYDIILMDDMMPKMTGKQAVKKLKENPNFKTPVIVLTANAITGMKDEYLAAGFDDYLSKPIEKKELERVIKEHIHNTNTKEINTSSSKAITSVLENEIDLEKTIIINSIQDLDIVNKKVLLVDDNELNIKVAQTLLKKYNLDITTATSGSECIEKVIEDNFDLILLDDMMPELNGCQTLDNLKTLEGFNTPVVMMTASSKDEVEEKIKEHKFSGYLSKPFKKEDLEEIFETLLNK